MRVNLLVVNELIKGQEMRELPLNKILEEVDSHNIDNSDDSSL